VAFFRDASVIKKVDALGGAAGPSKRKEAFEKETGLLKRCPRSWSPAAKSRKKLGQLDWRGKETLQNI